MAHVLVGSVRSRVAQARLVHLKPILPANTLGRTPLQDLSSIPLVQPASLCSPQKQKCYSSNPPRVRPASSVSFWGSRFAWKRAAINTLRCLVGCTLGDFSAMWFLQTHYPDLGIGIIMGTSSKRKIDPSHV